MPAALMAGSLGVDSTISPRRRAASASRGGRQRCIRGQLICRRRRDCRGGTRPTMFDALFAR